MLPAPRVTDRKADAPPALLTPEALARFEAVMLPLLDDAFTLARYLTGDEHDAQDVVQESYLRALRYFDGFRGLDARAARAWLLTIVRNVCFSRLKGREPSSEDASVVHLQRHPDPEAALLSTAAARSINDAVAALPAEFREVFVLRELEGLSYKEIADVSRVPIGTVMSRLSRARKQLMAAVARREQAGSAS